MAARSVAPPVIILASRESGGSFLSALLGTHPEFYGAPHLNVLAFEDLWQLRRYSRVPRDSNIHGLLRFLSDCLLGEQSVQSAHAALRWMGRRAEIPAVALYEQLMELVAPRRLVDYSPLYAQNRTVMARVLKAISEAAVIHVVKNPIAQGRSMCFPVWQTVMGSLDYWAMRGRFHPVLDLFEIGEQYIDWSTTPPVFDPQFAWHRTQRAALDLAEDTPADRAMRLNIEALYEDPHEVLTTLLGWLGADASLARIEAMLDSVPPPFDRPGPYVAPFGVDYELLNRTVGAGPKAEHGHPMAIDTSQPLSWRGDGEPILAEVAALAEKLGYRLA